MSNNPIRFTDPLGLWRFEGDNSSTFIDWIRYGTGDSRFNLNSDGMLYLGSGENTMSGGSVTFRNMVDAGLGNENLTVTMSTDVNEHGPSHARSYHNGVLVDFGNYNRNDFLGNRSAVAHVYIGDFGGFYFLPHEMSHALDWVLGHDLGIVSAPGVHQGTTFISFSEAVAITLTNQVAYELGSSFRQNFVCDWGWINQSFDGGTDWRRTTRNPESRGTFPFLQTGGQAAVMRRWMYGVNVFDRYVHFGGRGTPRP